MKQLWKNLDVSLIAFAAALVFAAVTFFFSKPLAIAQAAVAAVLFTVKLLIQHFRNERLLHRVQNVSQALDFQNGNVYNELTVPCVVVDANGDILWFNDAFMAAFSLSEKTRALDLQSLLRLETLDKLFCGRGYHIHAANHHFSVYSGALQSESGPEYLLYFFDETALRETEQSYLDSRPSVLLTTVDNAEELYQTFKESECAAVFSRFAQMIEDWAASFGALCRKLSGTRMIIIAEEHMLRRMIEEKFRILDQVRAFTLDGRQTEMTLSIGVGREDDFVESNNSAKQALDMAQSRGGDQVAIRRETQYQFFGGVSAGRETRGKQKTRLISKTICETMLDCENVLIMGHRFSDYDAIGSAIGVWAMAHHLGVAAHIVVDPKTTLSRPLCDRFAAFAGPQYLITPEYAVTAVKERTLVVVVDTHKKDFTECPALVDRAHQVIVIDHHRKSVGFIENTVVFYHQPNASSASEMVTELCQYVDTKPILSPMTAQALFAGISLDTRNFIIRTGVRTFEAAAYLRSRGANTVEARQLFAIDMEIFHRRNKIIDTAEFFANVCAISVTEQKNEHLRLITSQAADEMLAIEGVKASFVIFRQGSEVQISARSYGEINVQLIMEALGGGGHQTMAACQLGDISLDRAKAMLEEAILSRLENA